ncbi:hypothetical protein OIE66_24090 [Nonomuraea sp. NBC_01738]|uniref:hypothetical protein n=1 Tax=Nonomuraea sp. NBC_01738 TaxID=2976003 RepID=UPI002E142E85|nr:hypothetical protein OIE66_24090 [Nonomuraea sp. NBC_01738]
MNLFTTPWQRWHRPLTVSVGLFLVLMMISAAGLLVDDRQLMGESVWLKPLKFGFAFALYSGTLAWLLTRLNKARWLGTVFAAGAVVEVAAIAMQAARGTFSHFNTSTDPLTLALTPIFSVGVGVLFLANLVIAVMVLVQRTTDRPLGRAIRSGMGLAVLGMCVPIFYLVTGINQRTVTDANGASITLYQGHGIGDPDGHGMAVTNWSVTGGDWRVAHFVGLHGIQVLLLVAGLLVAWSARVVWLRDEAVRARLVGVASLGYFAVFALVLWQAHRGQALIHPDRLTLLALAGIVLVVVAAGVSVCVRASRTAGSRA